MKVAVWGLGKHAISNILPAIQQSLNLDLYGVLSRNKSVVEECKKDFECKSWKTTEDMLHDKKLDIIYVSTPPGLHFSEGNKILNSGKHFWCEKPFTTSLGETEKILYLSEQENLSVCEAFMYLYHPQYQKLKEIIQNNQLGEIETIECTFSLPELEKPGYRFDPKLGASAILDLGSYPLSILLDLFSNQTIQINDVNILKDTSTLVDISGQVNLTLGESTKCFLNWAYNKTYKNEITITGTESSLYLDKVFSKSPDHQSSLVIKDSAQNESIIKIDSANHFILMLESFFKILSLKNELDFHRKSILRLAKLIHKIKFYN